MGKNLQGNPKDKPLPYGGGKKGPFHYGPHGEICDTVTCWRTTTTTNLDTTTTTEYDVSTTTTTDYEYIRIHHICTRTETETEYQTIQVPCHARHCPPKPLTTTVTRFIPKDVLYPCLVTEKVTVSKNPHDYCTYFETTLNTIEIPDTQCLVRPCPPKPIIETITETVTRPCVKIKPYPVPAPTTTTVPVMCTKTEIEVVTKTVTCRKKPCPQKTFTETVTHTKVQSCVVKETETDTVTKKIPVEIPVTVIEPRPFPVRCTYTTTETEIRTISVTCTKYPCPKTKTVTDYLTKTVVKPCIQKETDTVTKVKPFPVVIKETSLVTTTEISSVKVPVKVLCTVTETETKVRRLPGTTVTEYVPVKVTRICRETETETATVTELKHYPVIQVCTVTETATKLRIVPVKCPAPPCESSTITEYIPVTKTKKCIQKQTETAVVTTTKHHHHVHTTTLQTVCTVTDTEVLTSTISKYCLVPCPPKTTTLTNTITRTKPCVITETLPIPYPIPKPYPYTVPVPCREVPCSAPPACDEYPCPPPPEGPCYEDWPCYPEPRNGYRAPAKRSNPDDGQNPVPLNVFQAFNVRHCDAEGVILHFDSNGLLRDQLNRIGYIADNFQFQFDLPVQSGGYGEKDFGKYKDPKTGDILLTWRGSQDFYRCRSGIFDNLYSQSIGGQCNVTQIMIFPCQE